MRAIVIDQPGDEDVMRVGDIPAPPLGAGELRIRVAAAAVNRADLMQRSGFYPPPPGASTVLGLECAGTVAEVAAGTIGWKVGDRAMALLAGGGYAEEVVVPAVCAMKVPSRLSLEQAAAVPEVFFTVFLNVFQLGALERGGWALVHGGGSGIGTAAIQMLKVAGCHSVVTAGTDEKCRQCLALGADAAVSYRTGDFVAGARAATDGKGVDVVLDSIGASYLSKNLASLAVGGRLVLIGLMGGAKAEIGLGELLVRRLSVIGSTLRGRPVAEKGALVAAFIERFGAALEDGRLSPVVDRVLPLAEAPAAHRAMKASEHFGKIVLSLA